MPVLALVGIFMFSFAHLTKILLDHSQSQAEIFSLAVIFMLLTFLIATQDVIVDGWAISLLSKVGTGNGIRNGSSSMLDETIL